MADLIVPPGMQLSFLIEPRLLFDHWIPDHIHFCITDIERMENRAYVDFSNYCEYIAFREMEASGYADAYLWYAGSGDGDASRRMAERIVRPGEEFYRISTLVWRDYYLYTKVKEPFLSLENTIDSHIGQRIKHFENVRKTESSLSTFAQGKIPAGIDPERIYAHLIDSVRFAKQFTENATERTRPLRFYYTYEYQPILRNIYGDDWQECAFTPPRNWHLKTSIVERLLQAISEEISVPLQSVPPFGDDVYRIVLNKAYSYLKKSRPKEAEFGEWVKSLKRIVSAILSQRSRMAIETDGCTGRAV